MFDMKLLAFLKYRKRFPNAWDGDYMLETGHGQGWLKDNCRFPSILQLLQLDYAKKESL